LWLACWTNVEIAQDCGCDEKTVRDIIGEMAKLPKLRKPDKAAADLTIRLLKNYRLQPGHNNGRKDRLTMSDEISMPTDIVAFAEELINGEPGALEIIKIQILEGDEDAHDEALELKHREFEAVHGSLVEELSKRFGDPRIAVEESEFDSIPLNGVFPAAMWEVEGTELFLAVSHEDRELPFLLAIGTA
jgi:hypothetical protein